MQPAGKVRDTAIVHAPLDRVWALSTRVELVRETLGMQLVSMPADGSIVGGSRVVWRGWKFGLPTEHHTLITGWSPPHDFPAAGDARDHDERLRERRAWFQDSQERGRFAEFSHDHNFRELAGPHGVSTILADHVRFALPWWTGGTVSSAILLRPYIATLVRKRFARIKQLAEGDGWREWL